MGNSFRRSIICIDGRGISSQPIEVYSNPAFQTKIGKQAPRGEVLHYPGEHFDFYHGMFEQVITDEIDFLRRHLLATPS